MSNRWLTTYQEMLDVITAPVLTCDWDAVCGRFTLPFQVHTTDGTHVCTTEADVRWAFTRFSTELRARGVTELRRVGADARPIGDNSIEGFHITEVFAGEVRLIEPFAGRMVITHTHAGWRVAETESIVRNADWPLRPGAPRPLTDDPTEGH